MVSIQQAVCREKCNGVAEKGAPSTVLCEYLVPVGKPEAKSYKEIWA